MLYNLKRALGISLALYAGTFVVGIISGIVSGQDMSSMENISDSFWYMGMIAAVVLTALCTLWYFKSSSVAPSPKSGVLFGLTAVVVSFIFDTALFSLGNTQGAEVDLGQYYGDIRFWIIVVLVLLTAKLVGFAKRQNP